MRSWPASGTQDRVREAAEKESARNSRGPLPGRTALLHAALGGHAAVVTALLARGAVDTVDYGGNTGLLLAAEAGHADTVRGQ